ncbi:MAG: iron-containing alcohol dehydrogenase, partial [Mariniphaga sp.]|nr:iron-containing alcohol dehydrogenase [Mariniphaga sp.]
MGINFEFATATRIIFGNGKISQMTALLRDAGRKVLLVTGKNQQRAAILSDKLTAEGFEIILFRVEKEPTTHI